MAIHTHAHIAETGVLIEIEDFRFIRVNHCHQLTSIAVREKIQTTTDLYTTVVKAPFH